MSNDGLFTQGTTDFTPPTTSIPLSQPASEPNGDASIGQLVSHATEQISALVRSEMELAKIELKASAKKGGLGAGFFGVAGVMALYSSFFFFFFLAELLSVWLDRWAAFLIVFLGLLVLAGLMAVAGLVIVKKVKAPAATIQSAKDLKTLVPGQATKAINSKGGLYT